MSKPQSVFVFRRAARSVAIISIVLGASLPVAEVFAQGCVVARGAGMSSAHSTLGEGAESTAGQLQASIAYRWLNSDRHFVGSEEQKERQREGSEVINKSHFVDVSFTYQANDRYSATLTVPFASHDRSSVVRDSNRKILQRYHTQNSGLADLRLTGNRWMLDPKANPNGNILLGLGFDLPTAKKDATDTFQVYDAPTRQIVARERTVDQSIQLGDGGYGILLDMFAYRRLGDSLSIYFNGYYGVTPEEKNGVPTFRGNPFEAEMSIADSFMARAGAEYLVWPLYNLTVSLDGRVEGVPVRDLVGGSDGFRRPGYAISAEPGVSARIGSVSMNLYAPIAVYRNRTRSVPDIQQTKATGVFGHGDAAFADSLVMFNLTKSF